MVFVRMLAKLLRDQGDRQADRADRSGRSAHVRHGSAVPAGRHLLAASASFTSRSTCDTLLYYKEAKDGQILEEGITEAGSMSSFIAAGTAYAHARHQHDSVLHLLLDVRLAAHRRFDVGGWRHARRGFLLGGTAGRTTLNGEGLQHQDGHSHLLALPGAEPVAPMIRRLRMSSRSSFRTASGGCTWSSENIFYYLTVMNEPCAMPPMPEGSREGILKGMYKFKASEKKTRS